MLISEKGKCGGVWAGRIDWGRKKVIYGIGVGGWQVLTTEWFTQKTGGQKNRGRGGKSKKRMKKSSEVLVGGGGDLSGGARG